jgi:regulator of replication initiation timing
MVEATAQRPRNSHGANAELHHELARLRAENAQLRTENQRLRAELDAHVRRAQSTAVFGPIEMTAGTCIGPRQRAKSRHGSATDADSSSGDEP